MEMKTTFDSTRIVEAIGRVATWWMRRTEEEEEEGTEIQFQVPARLQWGF